ncbi:MAG: hypothetical protein PUC32_04410 [Oscillospiraceae bacterium]|nr:hypothetical protein [Oscillospiraceae bacterium]
MNRTVQIAFCGITAALSTVIMLIAGVVPTASYALPALAGVMAVAVVVEFNVGWAFGVFAVTAGLSLLLVPDKKAVLLYLFFFGYYPILKALIERIKIKIVAYLVKFAIFNAAVIGAYFVALWLLALPADAFVLFGVSIPWVLLIVANAIFAIYDFALSGLVVLYYKRLHPIFSNWLHK